MEKKYCVLKKYLEEFNGVKINLKQICMYKLPKDSTVQEFAFKTENKIILRSNNMKTFYDFFIDKLINEADDLERKRSRWCLKEVRFLELMINKCEPLRGSSYIDLPEKFKSKKIS